MSLSLWLVVVLAAAPRDGAAVQRIRAEYQQLAPLLTVSEDALAAFEPALTRVELSSVDPFTHTDRHLRCLLQGARFRFCRLEVRFANIAPIVKELLRAADGALLFSLSSAQGEGPGQVDETRLYLQQGRVVEGRAQSVRLDPAVSDRALQEVRRFEATVDAQLATTRTLLGE